MENSSLRRGGRGYSGKAIGSLYQTEAFISLKFHLPHCFRWFFWKNILNFHLPKQIFGLKSWRISFNSTTPLQTQLHTNFAQQNDQLYSRFFKSYKSPIHTLNLEKNCLTMMRLKNKLILVSYIYKIVFLFKGFIETF